MRVQNDPFSILPFANYPYIKSRQTSIAKIFNCQSKSIILGERSSESDRRHLGIMMRLGAQTRYAHAIDFKYGRRGEG